MFHTAEVRWFYPGDLPTDILAWFTTGQIITAEERTDHYLIFPGCETIGVKIRTGQFEIKALKGGSEVVQFADTVTGRSDCWVKWSHSQPDIDWLQTLDRTQNRWIDVTKVRRQRRYAIEQGQVREVDLDTAIPEGGAIELTHIRAGGGAWWTLALEAYGEPNRMRATLQYIAETFFARYPPPYRFDTTRSCSYPVWLAGL